MVNDDEGMKCESESGIEIGKGLGSTTLLPNLSKTHLGNFIDLVGDF